MRFCFLFIISFALLSCGVQKRRYQSGYYLSWTSDKQSAQKIKSQEEAHLPKQSITPETNLKTLAQVNKDRSRRRDSCGFLTFSDKTEIKIQSLLIEADTVKYKRCGNPGEPFSIVRKSEVYLIQQANGQISYVSPEVDPKLHKKYLAREKSILKKKHKIPQLISVISSALSFYGLIIYMSANTGSTEIAEESQGVKFLYFLPLLAFAAIGTLFGKRALDRHKTDDEKRKAGGNPKFAIFLGILTFVFSLIFMAVLLG